MTGRNAEVPGHFVMKPGQDDQRIERERAENDLRPRFRFSLSQRARLSVRMDHSIVTRFRRIVRRAAFVFSIAMTAILVPLWVRSYFVADDCQYHRIDEARREGRQWRMRLQYGELRIFYFSHSFETDVGLKRYLELAPAGWSHQTSPRSWDPRTTLWDKLGFGWYSLPSTTTGVPLRVRSAAEVSTPATTREFRAAGKMTMHGGFTAWLPLWFLTLVSATPLLRRALLAYRRHRRQIRGTCRVCGYDLRASAERCPECGEQIVKADRGVQPL